MPHILIVEDEAAIADTLVYALQADGHSTEWVTLGGAALDQQRQRPADLVILDIGLPDISGFETCRQLRRFSEVPVMFLSARDGEIDRVVGLEIGADDYVVKPFSPREVAARVRAILKRMGPRVEPAVEATLFQLDTLRMQITYRGQPLPLPVTNSACCNACSSNRTGYSAANSCWTPWAWPLTSATSATSTAISRACAPSCARWPAMPNRSRPTVASATATARTMPDAPGHPDLPGVLPVRRAGGLLSAQHGARTDSSGGAPVL